MSPNAKKEAVPVEKKEPKKESSFPWLWLAIGAGVLVVGVVLVLVL